MLLLLVGYNRWDAHWHHLANTTEPSLCGDDAALRHISLCLSSVIRSVSTAIFQASLGLPVRSPVCLSVCTWRRGLAYSIPQREGRQ